MASSKVHAVGIDLGTTCSVVAYLDDLGRPQTLSNAEGDNITPSMLLFEGVEVIVGKEAVKAIATDAQNIAQCAKRDLGNRMFHKVLGGRQYPPEALQAWILNKLRIDAQRQIGEIAKAVITVPAYFDEVRRKATQDAGFIAGFEVLDIINEPTAAAIAFGLQQGFLNADGSADEKKKILVYDLGGGTFDVSVMEIGDNQFIALATDGDVRLGGHDWDQRLVDFAATEFRTKFDLDPRDDPNAAGRLWRECEDAKQTLSVRNKAIIACDFNGKADRIEITRQTFQELTEDLIERTAFTTRQALKASGLQWSDIDRVLMVGGSTRMPAVQEMLLELSGQEPDRSVSPDEAVSHGAALQAGLLLEKHTDQPPRFSITNVNSHSLGVAAAAAGTKQRRNVVLIPRNTPLPATVKRVFKTHKENQKSILVQIVEGESENPEDCSQIGKCSVRNLPPGLPAQTPIEVHFHYRENGRLGVTVNIPSAEKKIEHEILRDNGLTKDQLNSWREFISGVGEDESESENAEGLGEDIDIIELD